MSIASVLRESFYSFREDGCLNLSAAIAFYAILSLIPFLYLLVSLVSLFFGSQGEILQEVSAYISQLIPFISKLILKEVGRIHLGSGLFSWFAVFFMLWSSTLIFQSIEFSLKKVFKVEHVRPFWLSIVMSLLFVPVAGLVFFLLQVVDLFINTFIRLNDYFGITALPLFLDSIVLKYIFPFLLTFLLLSALYAVVPPGRVSLRQSVIGGFMCAVLLEVAKHVFSWMITRNPNFGLVYGSLNTIILMVLWIFYASAIFLFCAEIISAYQKQQAG